MTGLGGHVLKKLGDGLMALFGYPHAHENGAERAIRAALAIQRALADLNARNARSGAPELSARIGIECGSVVVDASGEVFGEAPNVAARVQVARGSAGRGRIVATLLRGGGRVAKMMPAQIVEARRRAREWQPAKQRILRAPRGCRRRAGLLPIWFARVHKARAWRPHCTLAVTSTVPGPAVGSGGLRLICIWWKRRIQVGSGNAPKAVGQRGWVS